MSARANLLKRLWLIGCLALAAAVGLGAFTASEPKPPALQTEQIEDVAVGQRVLGENPVVAQTSDLPEPDPATWRKVSLRMVKRDGQLVQIELLRSPEWIDANRIAVGASVELPMAELGAEGTAEVVAVEPCPAIQSGQGSVVTGTFKHQPSVPIVDLYVDGQDEPIGVTVTHLIWCENRQAFVKASELVPGDVLRSRTHGRRLVTQVREHPRQELVYTLEVQNQHVFEVTPDGLLVHNAQGGNKPSPTIDPRTGCEIGRFVVDSNGNVMIEPVGGSTVPAGPTLKGGVRPDTHTTYPNGSNYQRLNPQGHAGNPTPHAHGHAPGTRPGMQGQGPSLDIHGNPVPWNSPDAHWAIEGT